MIDQDCEDAQIICLMAFIALNSRLLDGHGIYMCYIQLHSCSHESHPSGPLDSTNTVLGKPSYVHLSIRKPLGETENKRNSTILYAYP